MDFMSIFSSSIIFVLLFDLQTLLILAANKNLKTYIIHVQSPADLELGNNTDRDQKVDLESWYHSFLPTTTTNDNIGEESESKSRSRLVYSYKHVFNGFAARLTREEVKEIKKKKGFISAQPQEILSLHTTHSPEYLGLIQNSGLWKGSNYGKGVIIGVLDSGITPKHPSFKGRGVPPPPAKWKGICQFDATGKKSFCNHKLIGIRYFANDENGSAKDDNGHGTHVASIAAGNYVHGANVYGNVNGTTKGVAPLAHLAIYKVCDSKLSCEESALIAGIDAAITDGVDVISISINGRSKPFHMNNVAIGTFRAMERGIFVSISAGNHGPSLRTLTEEAPWMLIVCASTTDRRIIAVAKLGNNEELKGQSLYQPDDFPSTMFPLVYPKSLNPEDEGNPYCWPDSFDYNDIEGKIVVCIEGGGISRIDKGVQVKNAGGVGMILMNAKENGYTIEDELHVLPTTQLSYVDGLRVIDYIESSKSPTATILFKGISFDNDQSKSPVVASFSSRGPSIRSRGILKPDILGPGVNIIAAWPFTTASEKDKKNCI